MAKTVGGNPLTAYHRLMAQVSPGGKRRAPARTMACVLLAAATTAQAHVSATPSDNPRVTVLDKAVDAQVRRFFENPCHVGLSIAVVTGAQTRYYNYGSTTRDADRLPSSASLYEIASVTKTFTGVLAAQALVEGRMDLDADFRAYLDGSFPHLEHNGSPVTLRALATHTSGLPRDIPDSDALLKQPDFKTLAAQFDVLQRGFDRRRYLEALRHTRLRAAPGAAEHYSNSAMMVIAYGLEHVYGQSFQRLMRRRIFEPLAMTSTGFVVDRSARARLVRGYNRLGQPQPPLPRAEYAAWGLYSDARDMARYVAWHLDVNEPVIAQAHAVIDLRAGDRPRGGGKGLIWNIGEAGGAPMLWHGGGSFGATSQVVLFPTARLGFALMANDACADTESDLKQIARQAALDFGP